MPRRETEKAAVGPQEDVLRQIAGIFVVPGEPVAEPINLASMPFDDGVEGIQPARQAGGHELPLVRAGTKLPIGGHSLR